jgi:hypothetical protein
MRRIGAIGLGAACLALAIGLRADQVTAQVQRPAQAPAAPAAELNDTIQTYCVDCHNDQMKRGDVTLEHFDIAKASENVTTAERMIRKLQAGMMPPPGNDRPDPATYASLITTLEAKADAASAAKPNPGTRVFPRLNRTEYRNSIQALLDIEVDPGLWLPLDQKSANFDNIADEQTISATLLESYRVVSQRGRGDQPSCGGRQNGARNRSYLHELELCLAASVGSAGRRPRRHARRHRRQSHLPG